jgi:hypothetical protein
MRRTPDLRAYAKLAKSESAPSSAPVPAAMATTSLPEQFKYGAHDPRRIDEVLRTPPDMKALAQVGRAVRDKKTP